jgi:CIC family chloride channel protein
MRVRSKLIDAELQTTVKMMLLSVLIGLVCAGAGVAFFLLIEITESSLLGSVVSGFPHDGHYRIGFPLALCIPLIVALGGLVSGALSHFLAPETFGGGENAVIKAYHEHNARVRLRVPFVKALASTVTLGTGGSAGREGPMAQISAGLGCAVSRLFNLSVPERRILVIAGTAAGISAVFRSPLGAAFLAVEILYSKLELETDALIYSIISAAVAYATAGFYFGWAPLFVIPPNLVFTEAFDLFWYAGLGLLAGITSIIIPEVFVRIQSWFSGLPCPPWQRPTIGGLIVGIIAIFIPEVLGAGYNIIQQAINGSIPILFLLGLGVAKIICFSCTVGSGGSGGVFAPVLFVGAVFGAAMALIFEIVFGSGPNTAALVVVSMAAFYSGIARAPITAVILTTELTGGYGLIVPTMLAVALSCLIEPLASRFLNRQNPLLYSAQVEDRFDSPTHHLQYVQAGLDIIKTKGDTLSAPVSLPEMEHLVRMSRPIPVGNKGSYIYRTTIHPGSEVVGAQIKDLSFVNDVLIASVFRSEEQLTPRGITVLEANDALIVICQPEVMESIRKAFEQPKDEKQS